MGINIETAKEAEKIAKRLSKERHGSEGLYEMYLNEAYNELFQLKKAEDNNGNV